MLRRLGLGYFLGLRPSTCRRSICSPSIHLLPSCSHRRELSATAAKGPGWVLLNGFGRLKNDSLLLAEANTTAAECRTSTGRQLRVFFEHAAPPASSFIYYDWIETAPGEKDDDAEDVDELCIRVVAVHGDSVLLKLSNPRSPGSKSSHFVYRATNGRSPSLSLLPVQDFPTNFDGLRGRACSSESLFGLLRRGDHDDDVLVLNLDVGNDRINHNKEIGELSVLRLGRPKWELKHAPLIIANDQWVSKRDDLLPQDATDAAAFAVGDRFLCWVQYECGFFLLYDHDVAYEVTMPKIRHVLFPPEVRGRRCWSYDHEDWKCSRSMGAAGDSEVRFVSIDRRCGSRSCFAFTVSTWTMKITTGDEPMTWVKDGELNCEELWALPGCEGMPRAILQCPVVCLENPDVVCFLVSNCRFLSRDDYDYQTIWMVQLNMKTKTLLSFAEFTADPWRAYSHFPAKHMC